MSEEKEIKGPSEKQREGHKAKQDKTPSHTNEKQGACCIVE